MADKRVWKEPVSMASSIIHLGFDPGGNNAFGVALLEGGRCDYSTVSSVDEAIGWVSDKCGTLVPAAAGIDTLLHWSCGPSGNRHAERVLRQRYPDAGPTIISPNSLRGAMVIGGVALGMRLREKYPEIVLNETHPKLLARHFNMKLLGTDERRRWISFAADVRINEANDHEVDAVISAWAIREALSNLEVGATSGWLDLLVMRRDLVLPISDVRYYWPR